MLEGEGSDTWLGFKSGRVKARAVSLGLDSQLVFPGRSSYKIKNSFCKLLFICGAVLVFSSRLFSLVNIFVEMMTHGSGLPSILLQARLRFYCPTSVQAYRRHRGPRGFGHWDTASDRQRCCSGYSELYRWTRQGELSASDEHGSVGFNSARCFQPKRCF